MRIRGFEVIEDYKDKDVHIPVRSTRNSAGYDIESAEDTKIPVFKNGVKPTLVKTGLKAYFEPTEALLLLNRSSGPKKGLVLANSVGLVDSDYYNNPDNEGHIMFSFYNVSDEELTIKKGDRIGQAVFINYLTTDNDKSIGKRKGGFGSTDKV